MRICVLALDDVFDTGLAALLDTFETASQLGPPTFDVTTVSVRRIVRTHHGFAVPIEEPPLRPPELAIIPAIACKDPATLIPALGRSDVGETIELLRSWFSRGARVAAACTSTFVLGRAGLLDGRRATTSWWLGPTFRSEFPTSELDESQMVVRDRRVITAGAALAHLDLALALVRERSPRLASLVARHLVLEPRPSQAPFVAPDHVAYDDELVRKFEAWVTGHISEPFELRRVARAVGASERTLQRRIRTVLGRSPIAFVQDLRLERAAHLLRTTQASVDDIARSVGYAEASTLRTLLRRKRGTGTRDLRRIP
jgi:transcriptional regulator GlxA family with amidase domain